MVADDVQVTDCFVQVCQSWYFIKPRVPEVAANCIPIRRPSAEEALASFVRRSENSPGIQKLTRMYIPAELERGIPMQYLC